MHSIMPFYLIFVCVIFQVGIFPWWLPTRCCFCVLGSSDHASLPLQVSTTWCGYHSVLCHGLPCPSCSKLSLVRVDHQSWHSVGQGKVSFLSTDSRRRLPGLLRLHPALHHWHDIAINVREKFVHVWHPQRETTKCSNEILRQSHSASWAHLGHTTRHEYAHGHDTYPRTD